MIDQFTKLIEDAGGYVNPDLRLLVGDEAEHGKMSLSGVYYDTLSLTVPWSLQETGKNKGPWLAFLKEMDYQFTYEFWRSHVVKDGVMPLIGAANHNQEGGRIVATSKDISLYGIDFSYSVSSNVLFQRYGIVE